jgi:predicted transcriptional regulator
MTGSERVGYEERLARVLARAQVALAAATPAVALTVREVAAILGTTTQTVNSWIRNGFPKRLLAMQLRIETHATDAA